jgi:predicted RNA-binding Zn ribbon-like protein
MNIHDPRGCSKALAHAKVLRDSLRKALAAIEAKKRIPPEWIMVINVVLRANEGYKRLVRTKAGWDLRFDMRRKEPLQVLVCVARSAAELIEQGLNAPVRKCGNPNCILYFYDVSRTRRRRWCSMAICGNRMKVAAYARRYRERRGMLKNPQ